MTDSVVSQWLVHAAAVEAALKGCSHQLSRGIAVVSLEHKQKGFPLSLVLTL